MSNRAPADPGYSFVSSEALDEAVRALIRAGRLSVSLVDTTSAPSLRIDGPCPRCDHDYSQTQGLRLLTSSVRGGEPPSPGQPLKQRSADFLCDCDEPHKNAPGGVRGCGANYTVTG